MQCSLLPGPLSCLVRRESCNQTDEALRSSSCYKNSVVSLELVSLRKRKDKVSVKVHCSLLCKSSCVPSYFARSDQDELLPQGTKWNTNLGPRESSSPPHLYASRTLLYGRALENELVLMLPASTGLLQPWLLVGCLSWVAQLSLACSRGDGNACCSPPNTMLCFGLRRWPTCLPLTELLFEVAESWVSSVLVRTPLGFAQIFSRLMCPGQMRPSFLRLPFFGLPPLRMVHG